MLLPLYTTSGFLSITGEITSFWPKLASLLRYSLKVICTSLLVKFVLRFAGTLSTTSGGVSSFGPPVRLLDPGFAQLKNRISAILTPKRMVFKLFLIIRDSGFVIPRRVGAGCDSLFELCFNILYEVNLVQICKSAGYLVLNPLFCRRIKGISNDKRAARVRVG